MEVSSSCYHKAWAFHHNNTTTPCLPRGTTLKQTNRRIRPAGVCLRWSPVRALGRANGGKEEEEEEGGGERESNLDPTPPTFSRLGQALSAGSRGYWKSLRAGTRSEWDLDLDFQALRDAFASALQFLERQQKERVRPFVDEAVRKSTRASYLLRWQLWPQFADWNRWELWKDMKGWDYQRIGVLVMYVVVALASVRSLAMFGGRISHRSSDEIANAFLEAAIPEPTPENVERLRKGHWRDKLPKGFRVQKYIKNSKGELIQDMSYIGDNPWDRSDCSLEELNQIIDESQSLTSEEKASWKRMTPAALEFLKKRRSQTIVKKDSEINVTSQEEQGSELSPKAEPSSASIEPASSSALEKRTTWQERLQKWEKVIAEENLKELMESENAQYVVPFDWVKMKANFIKEQSNQMKNRGFFMARKWWKYRPKLPYTYFLAKVERLEIEAAVYTEDTRQLYVTVKEGFPAEYIVDIPVDPYLFQVLKRNGVELDFLPRSNWYYYSKGLIVLVPSLLVFAYIRYAIVRAMSLSSEKIIDLLKADRDHLILPDVAAEKAKTQYKDVIVGADVWRALDEILTYMREPMKYHNRGVKLPRGVLISGPPGTGKTLLARAIARESGMPFVFASGAEFVQTSSGSGAEKLFEIFFTARANAPSFIFIDEIDALAGKNVKDDPSRRSILDLLLEQLDGEPEHTDVDRFSLRQAVVLICATNRPNDLDERFLRPGRVDRHIHIGLPGQDERTGIFGVHSKGRPIGEDVDFSRLAFRTAGYSGADIRNMINEAGIMAVRRGRKIINQQDLSDVLDKQLLEGMGMVLTEEEQQRVIAKVSPEKRRLLAVHEAGHILLAHLFPQFDWHAVTHLLPGGRETGISVFYPRQEMLYKGYTTVGYLKMQMVVAHGGRCAERIVLGDVSDVGQNDLTKISKIAREIAVSSASPRLGLFPMVWRDVYAPPKTPEEIELVPNTWNSRKSRVANMSVELSEIFTREVTRYVQETETEAMTALIKNRHILDKIVDKLQERMKLSGDDVKTIIKPMKPTMLVDYMSIPEVKVEDSETFDDVKNRMRYDYMDIYAAPLHRC